jgi:hypothetical protein
MAGRESNGNPFSGQGGRRPSMGGVRGGRDKGKSKRAKAKADPSPPFPRQPFPRLTQATRDWVRDDTPKERRKLERVVEKKNKKLRSKYRAVHGKVVDCVDHWIEEGWLFVSIRFQDQTDLRLQFGAKMVTDEIDLCDMRSGKFRLLRQYFRRRDL